MAPKGLVYECLQYLFCQSVQERLKIVDKAVAPVRVRAPVCIASHGRMS